MKWIKDIFRMLKVIRELRSENYRKYNRIWELEEESKFWRNKAYELQAQLTMRSVYQPTDKLDTSNPPNKDDLYGYY